MNEELQFLNKIRRMNELANLLGLTSSNATVDQAAAWTLMGFSGFSWVDGVPTTRKMDSSSEDLPIFSYRDGEIYWNDPAGTGELVEMSITEDVHQYLHEIRSQLLGYGQELFGGEGVGSGYLSPGTLLAKVPHSISDQGMLYCAALLVYIAEQGKLAVAETFDGRNRFSLETFIQAFAFTLMYRLQEKNGTLAELMLTVS